MWNKSLSYNQLLLTAGFSSCCEDPCIYVESSSLCVPPLSPFRPIMGSGSLEPYQLSSVELDNSEGLDIGCQILPKEKQLELLMPLRLWN